MATILLVDDEKILRTLLAVALRRRNYDVIEASSGRRALETLRKTGAEISLLISELSLPKMSGLELAGKIGDQLSSSEAVLLSRSPHPERLEKRAREAGHRVLREPFEFSVLLGETARILGEDQTRKPPGSSRDGAKVGQVRVEGE